MEAEQARIDGDLDNGTSGRKALLPDRHPTGDFFVCDILDAIPKDDMASMEHPIFSLSTKPDTRILKYQHNGLTVEITPSVRGLATIHDKDVLIYCISQLMAKKKDGTPPQRVMRLTAHDLMVSTNRETSGDGYRRLTEALDRLSGTRIRTNIQTGSEEITEGFGLIDSWRVVRQTDSGRMMNVQVTLSEWLYNSVVSNQVLTLHRDYFRLRRPADRRLYEIARKHCGQQDDWSINLETLQKKCGSNSPLRVFRMMVRELVAGDYLPDYSVTMEGDMVTFTRREIKQLRASIHFPILDSETFNEARIVAPGMDVYGLQQEWQDMWVDSGCPPLQNADKAFIGFCKKRGGRGRQSR